MKKLALTDYILIAGTASIFYGVYTIYPPVAFILLGGFLMFMGWPNSGESS